MAAHLSNRKTSLLTDRRKKTTTTILSLKQFYPINSLYIWLRIVLQCLLRMSIRKPRTKNWTSDPRAHRNEATLDSRLHSIKRKIAAPLLIVNVVVVFVVCARLGIIEFLFCYLLWLWLLLLLNIETFGTMYYCWNGRAFTVAACVIQCYFKLFLSILFGMNEWMNRSV